MTETVPPQRSQRPSMPPGMHIGPGSTHLQRTAHRRNDPQWLAEAWHRCRVLVVDDGRVLVRDSNRLVLLEPSQVSDSARRYFLGLDGEGTPYYAVTAAVTAEPGTRVATLREVGPLLTGLEADMAMTAIALLNWHNVHRFSPASGAPTTVAEGGWTRVTGDGETIWPRTDPAVIVLVHDGFPGPDGRCLLGHNAAWTGPGWTDRYSCLAGFVEPGESLEAAAVREVAEEVGVAVFDLRYIGSQSWPFPGSLMLGFEAEASPAQPLRLDPMEIDSARWFSRAEINAVLRGERTDFALPHKVSIAHYLIMNWLSAAA